MGANITFATVGIGDHGWASFAYAPELEIKKIPRADGCIVRRRGGGVQTITVHAWVIKATRELFDAYMSQLPLSFGTAGADLIINGATYSNTFFQSISPSVEHNEFGQFSVTFIRNAD